MAELISVMATLGGVSVLGRSDADCANQCPPDVFPKWPLSVFNPNEQRRNFAGVFRLGHRKVGISLTSTGRGGSRKKV